MNLKKKIDDNDVSVESGKYDLLFFIFNKDIHYAFFI